MEQGVYLDLSFICEILGATPSSRNFKEGEELLNSKHIILCEASHKSSSRVDVYALCLQTSALNSPPHVIEGSFKFSENKVKEVSNLKCSCKAGASSKCKHAAAVLLFCSRWFYSYPFASIIMGQQLLFLLHLWCNVVFFLCCCVCFFFLDDITQFGILSPTDKKCAWNQKKGPSLAQYTPTPLADTECFKITVHRVEVNEEEVASILMKACPNSALTKHKKGRSNLPCIEVCNNLEMNIDIEMCSEHLLRESELLCTYLQEDDNELMQFLAGLNIEPLHDCCKHIYNTKIVCENIVQICLNTHFNRGEWQRQRQFRITGSRAYEIFTYGKDNKWPEKASKYFWPTTYKKSTTMQHGIAFETPARNTYKNVYNCDVLETGLILSKRNPWLGYSPDGIILQNGKPSKLLEIKCIFKGREMVVSDAVKTCTFLKQEGDKYILKKKHKYYGQIQLGMAILNLQETDFVIFASKDSSFLTISVPRDDSFLRTFLEKLKHNFFTHMLHIACINK